MSVLGLRAVDLQVLPGGSAGLDRMTAFIELAVTSPEAFDDEAEARLRAQVSALWPDQSPGSGDSATGAAEFLPGIWPSGVGGAAAERLANWVTALIVAGQRSAHHPVGRGRVLTAGPESIRLAVPWWSKPLLRSAVNLAVRIVQRSSDPAGNPDDRQIADQHEVQAELRAIREAALDPINIRIADACARRGVPVALRPGFIQVGWGAAAERIGKSLTGQTGALGLSLARRPSDLTLLLGSAVVPRERDRDPGDTPLTHRLLVVRGRMLAAVSGSRDVTAQVHPDNSALAVRVARTVGLDMAAVDLRCPDIARSWRDVGGAVVEVHPRPDLGAFPAEDLHGVVVDAVLAGRNGRIPTAAITGTNGKSTTTAMLHHIWTTAGRVTGLCTTAQVRIGDDIISTRNLSGYPGARILLNDPSVEAAIFEMPRKGLIVFGHPCDRYDVGALLNVQDDHIGVDGIGSLEQMAELKAEVLQRSTDAVVINAQDPLCLKAAATAPAKRHILVTLDPADPVVAEHRRLGGDAVLLEHRAGRPQIIMASGRRETALMPVHDVPATMNGLLRFNEINAMFAAGLAWAQDLDFAVIRQGLSTFHNSRRQNPGRYNFFEGLPFQLLLDYGHNPDGVRELCSIVSALPVDGRRIFCTVSFGNRHAHHFAEAAGALAESFDYFLIGCDEEWLRRYRAFGGDDPAATALTSKRQALIDNGVPAERIVTGRDQAAVMRTALGSARSGDLLVLQSEPHTALPLIDEALATAPDTADPRALNGF